MHFIHSGGRLTLQAVVLFILPVLLFGIAAAHVVAVGIPGGVAQAAHGVAHHEFLTHAAAAEDARYLAQSVRQQKVDVRHCICMLPRAGQQAVPVRNNPLIASAHEFRWVTCRVVVAHGGRGGKDKTEAGAFSQGNCFELTFPP